MTTKQKEGNKKEYNHEEIKIRRVNFKFDKGTPRFYYDNNPFSTHFINVLHIVFPTGERFFVNSVLNHKDDIKDEKLKKQMKNFCGQEGIHSTMHERFWQILKDNDYEIKGFENHIDNLLHKVLAKIKLPFLHEDNVNLAVTACLEHFTALFGHAIFESVDTSSETVPEDIAELFKWHAAEEIEHKSVAFDVMQQVDDQEYGKRVVLMPIATALLYAELTAGTLMLLYQDRAYLEPKKLPKQLYDFGTGLFMDLHKSVFKDYIKFFKRDFHPSDLNDYHYAEDFFKDKAYA